MANDDDDDEISTAAWLERLKQDVTQDEDEDGVPTSFLSVVIQKKEQIEKLCKSSGGGRRMLIQLFPCLVMGYYGGFAYSVDGCEVSSPLGDPSGFPRSRAHEMLVWVDSPYPGGKAWANWDERPWTEASVFVFPRTDLTPFNLKAAEAFAAMDAIGPLPGRWTEECFASLLERILETVRKLPTAEAAAAASP